MNGYKAENPHFQFAEYSDLSSNFVEDQGLCWAGATIWLMSDGPSDAHSDTTSQLNDSNSVHCLQMKNVTSSNIVSVNILGLQ